MQRSHVLSVASLGLAVLLQSAQAQPVNPLGDPAARKVLFAAKSLKCGFTSYTSADWEGVEPEIKKATQEFSFHIDGIDLEKGAARLIGNAGAADLSVVRGENTLSFVEVVPTGAVNLTTVYAWGTRGRGLKAVSSRHTAIGGPSPSQNYGYCEPW